MSLTFLPVPGDSGPRDWDDPTDADLSALEDSGIWQDRALCAETDPEAFFPEKGESVVPAKGVCRSCPVRPQCLKSALENGERFGVWGGLSERERRRLNLEAAA
jgi:WhiB family redox-sensing transcriptional regulator